MSELVIGIDIGTSSTKGVLVRLNGEIVASAGRGEKNRLSLPHPGWAEHDAEQVWWPDFKQVCAELLARADGPVISICISGIGPCLLPADASGKPLRPAILYGIDTRATAEIEELTARYGEETLLQRCGSLLTSQAVGPKLLWLRRNEPEIWQQTRQFLMANSFIVERLTGEYVLDHHSASQCDPLYDMHTQGWIAEWAQEIAPDLPLPHLLWPGEIAGHVTPEAAAATGLPVGIPVAAGTVDAWAEALSVGVLNPGDLMLMYGTTMFLVKVQQQGAGTTHPTLWNTAGVLPDSQTLAAGMSTSGALTSWLREIAGDPPFEELLTGASQVAPGSDGLIVLPYFAGERTPLFDPKARGLICGLTLNHGRAHLYRALLESTAYGVRHILEVMQGAGGAATRLVGVGGGTQGHLWTQIVSDVLNLPQEIPDITIGACYGDALLAAWATQKVGSDVRWNPISTLIEPNPANHQLYNKLYDIYRQLYPATREQMHLLADIQAS